MAIILECSDCRGRTIILTDDTWYRHILPEHPQLTNRLDCIAAVLSDPIRIMEDVNRSSIECFYRNRVIPNMKKAYLKICVEFMPYGSPTGEVLTAFTVANIKQAERQLWP